MVYTMDKILTRYGNLMVLHRGEETVPFRGFLQPFRSKSQQGMQPKYTPLGKWAAGQYVLLAPAEVRLTIEDTVSLSDRSFTVKRIEPVMAAGAVVYYWGLCEEKGGEDTWGS